jgi:hypothetical protein
MIESYLFIHLKLAIYMSESIMVTISVMPISNPSRTTHLGWPSGVGLGPWRVLLSQGLRFDSLWCQFWLASPYRAKKKTLALTGGPTSGRWDWSP